MEVKMKPGYRPDLEKMEQTVKDAGYTPMPEANALIVTGEVVRKDGGLAIALDKMPTARTLLIVPAKEDPDTAAHLERHVGETVELEGLWQPDGEGKLAVTAIYGAEDKRPKR
jgi:hypothetical protein